MQLIRLGFFSTSVVARLAESAGYFAAHGLSVSQDAVPSSTEQFRRLFDGDYDVVLTSPDNVLNYRVNGSNPLGRVSDVRILGGVDYGLGLSLMAFPPVAHLSNLHGRRIAVDVATSGFAGVLFEMLAAGGLRPGDYEVLSLGSTPRRAAALQDGACDATLLNAGHDIAAEHWGAQRLLRVSDAVGRYPGSVLAARVETIEGRGPVLSHFLAAWDQARAEVLSPAHRSQVEAEVRSALGVSHDVATRVYDTLLDPREGLVADGGFELSSWELLVDLRARGQRLDPGIDAAMLRVDVPLAHLPPTAATRSADITERC